MLTEAVSWAEELHDTSGNNESQLFTPGYCSVVFGTRLNLLRHCKARGGTEDLLELHTEAFLLFQLWHSKKRSKRTIVWEHSNNSVCSNYESFPPPAPPAINTESLLKSDWIIEVPWQKPLIWFAAKRQNTNFEAEGTNYLVAGLGP